jgi:hemerythrin-like domain-containing protein
MEEHQYILRAVDLIGELARRVAEGNDVDERDIESLLQFLRVYGDDHHQEKEESILFPALLKVSHAEEHGCLCQITFEHNQQRSLLEGIEDALRSHKGQDFVYYAKRLDEIVRSHIQTEDEEVFKRMDAILSVEEDECIAKELAAYDSPYRAQRLTELLKRLVALELKYGIHHEIAFGKAQYG